MLSAIIACKIREATYPYSICKRNSFQFCAEQRQRQRGRERERCARVGKERPCAAVSYRSIIFYLYFTYRFCEIITHHTDIRLDAGLQTASFIIIFIFCSGLISAVCIISPMTRSDCVLQCFCCVQLRLEGIKLWPLHVHISIASFFYFSNLHYFKG